MAKTCEELKPTCTCLNKNRFDSHDPTNVHGRLITVWTDCRHYTCEAGLHAASRVLNWPPKKRIQTIIIGFHTHQVVTFGTDEKPEGYRWIIVDRNDPKIGTIITTKSDGTLRYSWQKLKPKP